MTLELWFVLAAAAACQPQTATYYVHVHDAFKYVQACKKSKHAWNVMFANTMYMITIQAKYTTKNMHIVRVTITPPSTETSGASGAAAPIIVASCIRSEPGILKTRNFKMDLDMLALTASRSSAVN